jgi:hypothetical protein
VQQEPSLIKDEPAGVNEVLDGAPETHLLELAPRFRITLLRLVPERE